MTTFLRRHWIIPLSFALGIYAGLPFLAPVFMYIGWSSAGRIVYFIYSWLCHQLPERSFFLYGSRFTYSLAEIQSAWQNTINPVILRQFIGNPEMGWKVAWSDRMVSMFTSLWLFGLLWWLIRNRLKPLRWWGLLLFLLPIVVDGTSHFVSDLAGIGQGFRYTNLWLAVLTHHIFLPSFYSGDAWGSFNSLMRLLTGFMFGLGIVWYTYPYLEKACAPQHQLTEIRTPSVTIIHLSNLLYGRKK
jgi:uncharacterized membrane protein